MNMDCRKLLLMVCVGLIAFPACSFGGKKVEEVCFYDQCIQAEVARTAEERGHGLMHREFLDEDAGMLFFFPQSSRQSFWMKNTLIGLDIIWMDKDKKIVFIAPNVLPCETEHCPVYTPDKAAKYVLEVNAGVATDMGLKVGDQAVF